ncbi:dihydrofolate reductase [Chryseobacterium sp. POL2]|uniref:dihydrofolate reductase n=1 Tax=Chryseobacterium sp. POL2 TaxID=2713414 RepID=UPI0013E12BD3|nr:dihydrofolate reductase [Chryseobacterium sp. POL2]QIG90561.1 dihydrofolate reductase [Chryseobacterium sp. POL2]
MISIVVAMGKNNAIGKENQLLWHLPEDLKHFKNLTSGHPIIMGRKTYESIGRALPNRTNIVVSRKDNWFEEGILIVPSLKEAIKHSKKISDQVFIIGGGTIYEQTIDLVDKLEVTIVDGEMGADTFFPKINPKVWIEVNRECHHKDEKNAYDYCFVTYERKENIAK